MCERFDELKAAGFVGGKKNAPCPFEKDCMPEESGCAMGYVLQTLDQDSRSKAIEPDDVTQSKALARLEAESYAKKHRPESLEDIKFQNQCHTLTSISRVN